MTVLNVFHRRFSPQRRREREREGEREREREGEKIGSDTLRGCEVHLGAVKITMASKTSKTSISHYATRIHATTAMELIAYSLVQ